MFVLHVHTAAVSDRCPRLQWGGSVRGQSSTPEVDHCAESEWRWDTNVNPFWSGQRCLTHHWQNVLLCKVKILNVKLFCLSVVLRPDQTAGIWLHYPEGQRAKGRRLPHKLKAQGLVDLKTALLGHTHPRGALWDLWSSGCPRGGFTSYITKAAFSQRKRCIAAGSCSWLGQLHMSQVRKRYKNIILFSIILHHFIWMLHTRTHTHTHVYINIYT